MLSQRTFKALRKKAIHSLENNTLEGYIEKCYRHYSKTYHTPLHLAREIVTVPEVVLIYMEDEMSEMDQEQIEEYKKQLGFVVEAVMQDNYSNQEESLDDDAWFIQMSKKAKEEEEKKKKSQDVVKKVDDQIKAFSEKLSNLTNKAEEEVGLDFEE